MRAVFALALVVVASAQILRSSNLEVIENSYIVVFHQNVTEEQINKHHAMLGAESKVGFKYNVGDFKGYSVVTTSVNTMLQIDSMEEVKYVEHDGMAYALGADECRTGQTSRSWGLGRVSGRASSIGSSLSSQSGEGADVYIIDTGIYDAHTSYTARFQSGSSDRFDSTGEGPGDQNGHGTHCAGTAMGDDFGVARAARLFEVKVLGRSGGGSFAGVIAGIDWTGNRNGLVVGSLSLGGGRQQAVNDAVDAAVANGAVMAIASGNSNANACNFSPASAPNGITVNSMQTNDARSTFTNFGTCSDIFAPGTSITSAWIGNPTATNTISGTSMACPHVAGLAASHWGANPSLSPAAVQDFLIADATQGVITGNGVNNQPPNLGFSCS